MGMEKDANKTVWLSPLVLDRGFEVQFRDDHVHVELGEDFKITPETQNEFWSVVADACAKHDSRRVLVEGFVPAGERDASQVIDAGQRTATVPNLWLAFCLSGFEPTPNSELFETIAASRGVRVKFYPDPARALQWLRANSPQ